MYQAIDKRALITLALVGLLVAILGCAPSQLNSGGSGAERRPTRPNILRTAITSDITIFHDRLKPVSPSPAGPFVNAGLTRRDENDVLQPVLLERLPSQADGSWIVNADGTMKTLLTLRNDLKWQDGQPLTSADFVLAHRIYRDRDIPLMSDVPERYMSSVVAVDDRTVEVNWSQLYVDAGTPASAHLAPIPRHLLGDLYERDKTAFINSPFWNTEQYVGAGPFKVVSRDPGVRVMLEANPHFVFGRPAIGAVEMHVVPDMNTIVVRVLAAEVDFVYYQDISALQAQLLREQWEIRGAGTILTAMVTNRGLAFQYRDVPNHQKALLDVRVRRAIMHAIDREDMGRVKTAGLAGLSDTPYYPEHYLFPRVKAAISAYPLDTRRTEALLNEAGWTKAADGLFRNATGQTLDVEMTASSDYTRTPLILADNLKRAGLDARPFVQPEALDADAEHRASYPGATAESFSPGGYANLTYLQASTPANAFRGRNRGNYSNPQMDTLHDRLSSTLQERDRDDILIEIERLVSGEVAVGHLYYQVRPAVVINGLKGVVGWPYMHNTWEWRFE